MIREELLEIVSRRVEEADVFESETDRLEVEFRQGRLYSQETKLSRGWGVRVINEGRLGFASSTDPDRLTEMAKAAIDLSAYGKEVRFHLPVPAEPASVKTIENRVMLVSAARLVEWGRDLIDALSSRVPDLKVDVRFNRTYQEIGLVSTAGVDLSFERAGLETVIAGLLVDDGLFWITDYLNLSGGQHFPLEDVVERMERLARLAKQKARLPSGEYPVVVMPNALAELLYPLMVAANGKHREKGTSPLVGQEDKQVLGEKITIVDNRLHDFGLESAPFDGEGVPAKRKVLFENGVFKGFLFDIATGTACGCDSTGSAVRGYFSLPQPGTSNIEVSPGGAELEAVIGEMGTGLVVYEFIGGGQSNVLAGEVALNVACGFKIENGAVAGRVKDVSIAGNVYEMFQRVEAVGSTQRDLGSFFLPFIKFANLKVATKE
ncbi:MAG: TldD/PmbA family protein [bacterium]